MLRASIVPVPLPTPFAVGRVNCYLIEDEPLTLVDAGPRSSEALDELERALGERGHELEDVGLLLLTHQHHDHVGLAGRIKQRSGAEVASHSLLARFLADYAASMEAEDSYQAAVMALHGVPAETIMMLREVSHAYRVFGDSVEVDRHLEDGDSVELAGRRLTVARRPGHSPTDTLFIDVGGRQALVGDHLIAHISSNPVVHRPPEGPADPRRRPAALATYLESLRRTAELDLDELLPGHGVPITNHGSLVAERIQLHMRRKERIAEELSRGARTGHELALALWGDIAARQAFLTLSEVLGHADLLIAEGRVRERERDDGLVEFEAR